MIIVFKKIPYKVILPWRHLQKDHVQGTYGYRLCWVYYKSDISVWFEVKLESAGGRDAREIGFEHWKWGW